MRGHFHECWASESLFRRTMQHICCILLIAQLGAAAMVAEIPLESADAAQCTDGRIQAVLSPLWMEKRHPHIPLMNIARGLSLHLRGGAVKSSSPSSISGKRKKDKRPSASISSQHEEEKPATKKRSAGKDRDSGTSNSKQALRPRSSPSAEASRDHGRSKRVAEARGADETHRARHRTRTERSSSTSLEDSDDTEDLASDPAPAATAAGADRVAASGQREEGGASEPEPATFDLDTVPRVKVSVHDIQAIAPRWYEDPPPPSPPLPPVLIGHVSSLLPY